MSRLPFFEATVEAKEPTSLTWTRRADLDAAAFDAWELPDGCLYAEQKGLNPVLVLLSLPWLFDRPSVREDMSDAQASLS